MGRKKKIKWEALNTELINPCQFVKSYKQTKIEPLNQWTPRFNPMDLYKMMHEYAEKYHQEKVKSSLGDVSENLPPNAKEMIEEARWIWAAGRKLRPAMLVRDATGMGLKEAKIWCEENFR